MRHRGALLAGCLWVALALAPGAGQAANMVCAGGTDISLKAYGRGGTNPYIKNSVWFSIAFARALLAYSTSGRPAALLCQYMVKDVSGRSMLLSLDDFNITDTFVSGVSNCKPRYEVNWTLMTGSTTKSCMKGDPGLCELTC